MNHASINYPLLQTISTSISAPCITHYEIYLERCRRLAAPAPSYSGTDIIYVIRMGEPMNRIIRPDPALGNSLSTLYIGNCPDTGYRIATYSITDRGGRSGEGWWQRTRALQPSPLSPAAPREGEQTRVSTRREPREGRGAHREKTRIPSVDQSDCPMR